MVKISLLSILFVAGCSQMPAMDSEETRLVKGFPVLPEDARQVVERQAECNHWAGETGDNPPEREQEIHVAVVKLRCDRIEQDVAAMRSKYAGNDQVEKALAAAEDY
jgi:hypothetical protein